MAEIRGARWDDLERVHDLLGVRSRAVFGISEQELQHLRHGWELPAFEVGRDNWLAVDGERLVGYAELRPDRELIVAADADVAEALLARGELHARGLAATSVTITVVAADKPLHVLVERSGYTMDREVLRMWRALDGVLPVPTWPEGVSMRTYTDADGEAVHALLDAAYTWDESSVAQTHVDWLAFMTKHDDFDPELWLLAERDEALVGCALHWKPSRGDGWVKDLAVDASERGRGLGAALLHAGFAAYAARDAQRVGLKVDTNNPTGAPRLYAREGFVVDRRYELWVKQL